MNCIAFRRALSVRPGSEDPAVLAHRRACAECEAFARRQAAFERALGDAVRIPVPEGLASRVLVAHGVGLEGVRRVRRRRLRLAFVASAAFGLLVSWLGSKPEPLDRAVVTHIDRERSHLVDRWDLSPDQVNQVLAPLGISVAAGVGPVHYAGTCPIRKHLGAHLVLEGEKGPVTVLLMPGEPVPRRLMVHDGEFEGIIVPAGDGSVAIVGQPGERLDGIERRVRLAVRFASREGPGGRLGRGGRDG
jgi:hypothetical protein